MALITFHDDCSSVEGWTHGGETYSSVLKSDGSKLYYIKGHDNPGKDMDYKPTFYGYDIPATVNFTVTAKLVFDPSIQEDVFNQALRIVLCKDITDNHQFEMYGLFWIEAIINDGGTPSVTTRRVVVSVGKDQAMATADYKYSKTLDADTTELEIKVVKVVDEETHYLDFYYDDVFCKRIDATLYVSSAYMSLLYLRCSLFQNQDFPSWARIEDIKLEWELVPIESFAFDKHDVTLIKYQSETVNLLISPENAYCTSVDVYSLNENIAVPLVAGVGVGNTAIVGVFNAIDPVSLEPAQYSDMVRVTVLTNLLDTPAKPVWSGKKITWNQIENAVGYEIWIYKDNEMFASYTVDNPETLEYDLADFIADLETWADNNSIITASVQATGDNSPYYSSEFSALSEIYVNGQTRKQYVQVEMCLESDPDAVIKYRNNWYKVIQDLEVFTADVYTDISRTINYKNGGSVVTYSGNDYLYIMSGISDLYTDSGFTDFKPGEYRSLKPLRIRENVVSFYYYLPDATDMTISYPTEIKSANPIVIIDAGISLPLGALYHFKLTSYADSGAVTQIATVNSKDNPELFKYSLDEGITWKDFPAGGVANTNTKLLVAARVNVGPRAEVWILPSKELVT